MGFKQRAGFTARTSASEPGKTSNVTIIGVGGVGTAVVSRLSINKPRNCRCVNVDSDRYSLERRVGDARVLLHTRTVTSRGDAGELGPEHTAAVPDVTEIRSIILGDQCRNVVLVAGLGGGTGSAASPMIAAQARAMGATVAAIVTIPLSEEASWRIEEANVRLLQLKQNSDYLIVIPQDRLAATPGDPATWGHLSRVGTLASKLLDDGAKALADLLTAQRSLDDVRQSLNAHDPLWRRIDLWSMKDASSDSRTQSSVAA